MSIKTRLIKIKIDPSSKSRGRIDTHRVDATTEEEIEAQIIQDDKEAEAASKIRLKSTLFSPKLKKNRKVDS